MWLMTGDNLFLSQTLLVFGLLLTRETLYVVSHRSWRAEGKTCNSLCKESEICASCLMHQPHSRYTDTRHRTNVPLSPPHFTNEASAMMCNTSWIATNAENQERVGTGHVRKIYFSRQQSIVCFQKCMTAWQWAMGSCQYSQTPRSYGLYCLLFHLRVFACLTRPLGRMLSVDSLRHTRNRGISCFCLWDPLDV